jgi:hypothetical protein
MSATSAPFGFRPSYHNSGQIRPKVYAIASGYAANIFAGDPVKLMADGVIQLATTDGTRTGTTHTVKTLGVFAGVEYVDSTGKPTVSNFWPTGTSVATGTTPVAYVYDDPETLFDVVYANPGTPGTTSMQVDVGAECDWTISTTGGSTSTGLSSTLLTAIVSDGQYQITGFSHNIADDIKDAYIVATVRINLHQYKAAVSGV